jgi:superfamily II DNA or RNA helicase
MSRMAAARRLTDLESAVEELRASLRPYQAEGLAAIEARVDEGRRRILYILPPAGGKTMVAVMFILGCVTAGKRVLFVAHRRSLIMQAAAALIAAGLPYELLRIETGEHTAGNAGAAVTVASVQALAARGPGEYDVVVVDEAHRCAAKVYAGIVRKSSKLTVLGLTGTPWRLDGKDLSEHFDCYVAGPQAAELASMGHISMPEVFSRPLPMLPDMSGAKLVGGDYAKSDLRRAVSRPGLVEDIVETWIRRAEDRPTILFASGIAHSKAVRDEFKRRGVVCSHIDGTMSSRERQEAVADVLAGKSAVLCNSDVMAEGVDIPPVRCVVMARPLTSTTIYLQQLARCMRVLDGAASAIILDHAGNVHLHGLPDEERDFLPTPEAPRWPRPPRKLVLCSGCGRVIRAGSRCSCPRGRETEHVALISPEISEVRRTRRVKRVEGLVRAREEAGLKTALAASRATGFNYGRLVALETGRQSPWSEKFGCWTSDARRLADAYGLRPEDLWAGKDEPPSLQARQRLIEQEERPGWHEPHSILFTDAEMARKAVERVREDSPMLAITLELYGDPPEGGMARAIVEAAETCPPDTNATSVIMSSRPANATARTRQKAVWAFREKIKEIESEASWKAPRYFRRTPDWWDRGAIFWDQETNTRARVTDAYALGAEGTSTKKMVFLDYGDLDRLEPVNVHVMSWILRLKRRLEVAMPDAIEISGLTPAGTIFAEALEIKHAEFKVGLTCSACGLRVGVVLSHKDLEVQLKNVAADSIALAALLDAAAKAGMDRECLGRSNIASDPTDRTIWTHGTTHCEQFGTKFGLRT